MKENASIKLGGREHRKWNEEMFIKYNNERMYFHPNPVIRYTENKRVNLILRLLSASNDDKIIELGCGEAHVLNKVDDGMIVGIDMSTEAIKRAKAKLKNREKCFLIQGDIQRAPVSTQHFDKVICTEVIEHVVKPYRLIEEIARIAKNDATIVITIPNEDLINRVKSLVKKLKLFDVLLKDVPADMNKEWHLHSFNLEYFRKISNGSLKIEEITATPFRLFPIRYILRCSKI